MAIDKRLASRRKELAAAALCCAVMSAGCQPTSPPARPAPPAAKAASSAWDVQEYEKDGITPRRYSVVPYGYNYTDGYIDSFEVDGAGGGNLAVSTSTSPGGGSVCCTTLVSGLPRGTEFVIKWSRDGEVLCEQIVKLERPIPPDPHYLEVHFYQDGHIELEATHQASPPRLKLDRASYAPVSYTHLTLPTTCSV